jgi:hypothetical protein
MTTTEFLFVYGAILHPETIKKRNIQPINFKPAYIPEMKLGIPFFLIYFVKFLTLEEILTVEIQHLQIFFKKMK